MVKMRHTMHNNVCDDKRCNLKLQAKGLQVPDETAHIVELLESLEGLSGLDGVLFEMPVADEQSNNLAIVHTTDGCKRTCSRCAHVPEGQYWSDACVKAHVAAGMLADRYGGKYAYVCPEKKLFAAAPVIKNRRVIASLIIGPAEIEMEGDEQPEAFKGYEPFRQCSVDAFHEVTLLLGAIGTAVSETDETYLRRVGQMDETASAHMGESIVTSAKKSIMREYPIASENDMVAAIKAADPVAALAAFDRVFGAFNSYGMTRGDHKAYERLSDLTVVIARAALDAGVDTTIVFDASERCREELQYMSTALQVYHRIRFLVKEVVGFVLVLQNLDYDRNIYRVQTYVQTHYSESIPLERIAADVGYSPSYLSRTFKEKTGMNLMSFINKVRIDAAMSDLRTTDYSVSDVARRCGFENVGYFTRVFKKLTGVTPGYFRNHAGQVLGSMKA